MLRIIDSQDPVVEELRKAGQISGYEVLPQVMEIIDTVRRDGDRALYDYTERFDGASLAGKGLQVTAGEIEAAYDEVTPGFLKALRQAKENIINFHRRQLEKSWWQVDEAGNILGQLYRPLTRVGLYVPGGRAAYPSSVLMTALPGLVAGVKELVMVTPPGRNGTVNPYTLVAAKEAGVTEIYKIGGAQAVAALTYGTETINPVDKIVGPGNIYVTMAKKLCYGDVDIDMLAGPSEILIIADQTANPVFLAADLLSQAEHDPLARSILITPERDLAEKTAREVMKQLAELPRREIAGRSLEHRGAIIITADLGEAFDLANRFAPEHLELCLDQPFSWLGRVENAGAVFLGHYSPESLGDYYAGPNHVLPTGGTARFSSPLNVDMYMKKTSLIGYTQAGLLEAAEAVEELARVEGLAAHGRAVAVRRRVAAWEEKQ
ncbi:MAG TPA: histidinol dehydrogenase [Clostridia bacterium]|nr:histidinol dehydrogenase [Clostridia bacterium]